MLTVFGQLGNRKDRGKDFYAFFLSLGHFIWFATCLVHMFVCIFCCCLFDNVCMCLQCILKFAYPAFLLWNRLGIRQLFCLNVFDVSFTNIFVLFLVLVLLLLVILPCCLHPFLPSFLSSFLYVRIFVSLLLFVLFRFLPPGCHFSAGAAWLCKLCFD